MPDDPVQEPRPSTLNLIDVSQGGNPRPVGDTPNTHTVTPNNTEAEDPPSQGHPHLEPLMQVPVQLVTLSLSCHNSQGFHHSI
jgi:hypothetical protein